ncbi:MAG: hypothetical protein NT086_01950 [Proteobacteria bacterium]|nr:hypothetical protein [Pseudomonadota bacterium]
MNGSTIILANGVTQLGMQPVIMNLNIEVAAVSVRCTGTCTYRLWGGNTQDGMAPLIEGQLPLNGRGVDLMQVTVPVPYFALELLSVATAPVFAEVRR